MSKKVHRTVSPKALNIPKALTSTRPNSRITRAQSGGCRGPLVQFPGLLETRPDAGMAKSNDLYLETAGNIFTLLTCSSLAASTHCVYTCRAECLRRQGWRETILTSEFASAAQGIALKFATKAVLFTRERMTEIGPSGCNFP